MSRPRLCFVTAVPMTVNAFLRAHIEHLAKDYEVFVISDFSSSKANVEVKATCLHVPLAREIAIGKDLRGVFRLVSLFRAHRFDIVLSVTPKAGLLAMMASFLARVPTRIHWFTGQVWVTRHGFSRSVLRMADRLIAVLATRLLADSPSQRAFLIAERIAAPGKLSVIAEGSICGVDIDRFHPDPETRLSIRATFGIPESAPVVLYLGRLTVDKGLRELAATMQRLGDAFPAVHWLFVGPDEESMAEQIRAGGGSLAGRLHFQGFTAQPESFMAAADIFCLPSYREGFGSSILEAAAVGVPGVATRIYGLYDAVEDGVTGLLVPPRDVDALAEALATLLQDAPRRNAMGQAARTRVVERFAASRIVEGLAEFLEQSGARRGCP